MKSIKLICFPYAGGNANFYLQFKHFIPDNIEIVTVEYPGHGKRMDESLSSSKEELLKDVINQIYPIIKNSEFAILGYSIGSIIAYEVIKILKSKFNISPIHSFFFAILPPHINAMWSMKNILTDMNYFYNSILSLGGIPKDIQKNTELMNLFIPIIYNDIKIFSEEFYFVPKAKYKFDISIFYSEDDDYDMLMNQWSLYTSENCFFYKYKGNHFFINNYWEDVALKIVNAIGKR